MTLLSLFCMEWGGWSGNEGQALPTHHSNPAPAKTISAGASASCWLPPSALFTPRVSPTITDHSCYVDPDVDKNDKAQQQEQEVPVPSSSSLSPPLPASLPPLPLLSLHPPSPAGKLRPCQACGSSGLVATQLCCITLLSPPSLFQPPILSVSLEGKCWRWPP